MQTAADFNWPIIGHKRIKQFLQTGIIKNSLAHAYLFYGPRQVGKTLTAKLLAKSILCENYSSYLGVNRASSEKIVLPCGECNACRQFDKNIYADFYLVEREINEKTGKKKDVIAVSQIRELLEKVSRRAFLNSYKIVLIPEAEALNKEAGNCLLKTLEEPAPRTIIILIGLNKNLLLPTILSRCQILKFLPVKETEIYQYLLDRGANRSEAKELSAIAYGRPTVAMKFFTDQTALSEYKRDNTQLLDVLRAGAAAKFKWAESVTKKNEGLDELTATLNQLSGLARDLLLINCYKSELMSNQYLEEKLSGLSGYYSPERLAAFLGRIEETKALIGKNINPRLALESLLLFI